MPSRYAGVERDLRETRQEAPMPEPVTMQIFSDYV